MRNGESTFPFGAAGSVADALNIFSQIMRMRINGQQLNIDGAREVVG